VYFLANSDGYIKIGYTKNIKRRIQNLETGSSSKLYLCGYIKSGTYKLEQELHKKFHCKQGEWFYTDGLIDYINRHNDMSVDLEKIDNTIYVYKKMKIVN